MMFPEVWPEYDGALMPVGTAPDTSVHCTGLPNVLPPAVVLQPVVSNQTTPLLLTARFVGPAGVVITQVPVGGAGVVAGATFGVHPLSVTVTRTDRASW